MNKHYLTELADELEAEHGSYPKSRDHFEQWLMLVMAMISAAVTSNTILVWTESRRWPPKMRRCSS